MKHSLEILTLQYMQILLRDIQDIISNNLKMIIDCLIINQKYRIKFIKIFAASLLMRFMLLGHSNVNAYNLMRMVNNMNILIMNITITIMIYI